MSKPFDLVLGRKTYEIFAAHWPHTDDPGAEPLNSATKHVASTTLTELEWENSKLIEGDVPEGIRALKQQDGPELQVHGSANLIQTLLEHGLIDEFRLWIFPLVLGKGKRLFDGGTVPAGLELASSQVSLHRSDHGHLPKRRRDQGRLLRRRDAERGGAGPPRRAGALSEARCASLPREQCPTPPIVGMERASISRTTAAVARRCCFMTALGTRSRICVSPR